MKNIFYRGLGVGALYGILGIILAKYLFENPGLAPDYKWIILIIVSCAMLGSMIFSSVERSRQGLYFAAKRTHRDLEYGDGSSNIFNKIVGALLGLVSIAILYYTSNYTYPVFIFGAILFFLILSSAVGIFNGKKYGLQILTYIGGFLLMGAIIYALVAVFTEFEVNRALIRVVGIGAAVVIVAISYFYNKINDTLEY